jgi:tRNA nucleotidyltransferase (CCA-adding enzyme)
VSFPAALDIPEPVLEIARTLDKAGHEVWCVGGALRDALLGESPRQYDLGHTILDLATSATPDQVRSLFRRSVATGIKYGTVGVFDRRGVLHDVTTFRRDVETDGRHAVVQYGVSLEEDLARRDFTINAIAYHPLRHEWRDPFSGAKDLERRLIRAVGKAAERFQEDYLRILRALRFAARFDFTIDSGTWKAAQAAAPGLAQLSAERVREEWFRGLQTARSITRFAALWIDVGAARAWIPELERGPFADRQLSEPPTSARDPILLTAYLTSSPASVLRRLKASNAEIVRAEQIENGPREPGGTNEQLVRRWLSAVGGSADDLTALWQLRHQREPAWSQTVRQVKERNDPLARSDLAISGADLQREGLSGLEIGRMLAVLLDRVLDDPSLNTRDRLLALVREGR